MSIQITEAGGEGQEDAMRNLMGPGQIDQMIRNAVHWCWMTLPKEQRSPDEVERHIRRLVDRALRDFQEDRKAFGYEA